MQSLLNEHPIVDYTCMYVCTDVLYVCKLCVCTYVLCRYVLCMYYISLMYVFVYVCIIYVMYTYIYINLCMYVRKYVSM